MKQAAVHLNGGLSQLLPRRKRREQIIVDFKSGTSVKHLIEALGIPHTEIGEVLVNGQPGSLSRLANPGDQIEVFPHSTPRDIASGLRFIADTHLGRLAAYLRMLGYDTLYQSEAEDKALAEAADKEGRILLTRDRGLLMRNQVRRGMCILQNEPAQQLTEVARAYRLLDSIRPFERCMRCNTPLEDVSKAEIVDRLPEGTRGVYDKFRRCPGCGQIYWKGPHYQRMEKLIEELKAELGI